MKKVILLSVLVVLVMISCDKKSKQVSTDLSPVKETIQSIQQELSEGQKVAENLSKKTPLAEDELKNAFPKNMNELPVDDKIIVVGQQVMGSFGDNKISLSITDAAGMNNQLASFFIDSYLNNKEFESTDSFQTLRKERNGIKTSTNYYENNGKSELSLLYNNRYLVIVENNDNQIKMTPDQLWEAFDINALENYK